MKQTTAMAPRQSHPAIAELETYRSKGANLLLPSTNIEYLSEFHAPVIDKCYLSPNPDEGDVYPASYKEDCNEFRIAAQGLRKISMAAGVVWHPLYCKRLDDRKDRNYVAYQAMGGIKKSDGSVIWWKGEYDLDFEVIKEELYEQYHQKSKNWSKSDDVKKGFVESSVRRDMIFKRKHKLKLAETGAMNRVVRSILALKNHYTKAELQNPFVAVRIVMQPDYSNKDVRAAFMKAAIESTTNIYGGTEPKTIEHQDNIPPVNDEDVIDVPTVPDEKGPPEAEEEPEPENGSEPSALELFLAGERADRIKYLEELAKRKDVDLEKIVTVAWKHFADKNFIKLFEHLMEQPDYDDIPF